MFSALCCEDHRAAEDWIGSANEVTEVLLFSRNFFIPLTRSFVILPFTNSFFAAAAHKRRRVPLGVDWSIFCSFPVFFSNCTFCKLNKIHNSSHVEVLRRNTDDVNRREVSKHDDRNEAGA